MRRSLIFVPSPNNAIIVIKSKMMRTWYVACVGEINFAGKLEGRSHVGELGLGENIILKWIEWFE
jgi:hypothetical protein